MQLNHMHFLGELPNGSLPAFNRGVVCRITVLQLTSSEDERVRLLVSHVNTNFVVYVWNRSL